MNTVQRLRQETGEGDLPPPPRQPHPVGAIPHGYSVGGSGSLFAVSPDTPPKILPQPMCTAILGQSPHTARPLSRGREEAAERPGGGGGSPIRRKRRFR